MDPENQFFLKNGKNTPRYHFTNINDSHMIPQIWSATDRIFCYFGLFFAFLPPNNLKNQNFEKMKQTPGDIIILYMCNINHNHLI